MGFKKKGLVKLPVVYPATTAWVPCVREFNLYYVIWRPWKHWYQQGEGLAGIS